MFDTQRFREVVEPVARAAGVVPWDQVEAELGHELPSDYKWLVENYGPGTIDGFLEVLQPVTKFAPIRLQSRVARSREILKTCVDHGEVIPADPSELVAVAVTDNGDTIYWVTRPRHSPDSWTIALNAARNDLWEFFDGGVVSFLTATLAREVTFALFPRNFPGRTPVTFTAHA
ncbi:SMI1/KNR4 family protein [Actinacidiphila rubida]|uniref:SMI1/KNR4 family protein n=1 Tax=Actinacidiphila rubida TaxID=310780 RepID=UPI00114C8F59|nr:SMI1/KNR4 family protein [Actinacidiphila rubida]